MMPTRSATLMTVLRPLPFLSPEDSVCRAVEMLRREGADTLPVVSPHGALSGVVSLADLRPLLGADGDSVLTAPIQRYMRRPERIGHAAMTLDAVRRELAGGSETTLFIVDEARRYLGGVTLADLLAPESALPRPVGVGGMATPWGVYLTNGVVQAGASGWALVLTGAIIGALLIASHEGLGLACWGMEKALGWPVWALWNTRQPAQVAWSNLDWFLLKALTLPLFLLMIRALPLAGYHAAEHQAVHALERGEPLCPEVVRRMPRVHPRCGTNLMAGGLMFAFVSQGLVALRVGLDAADSALLGAVVALFTWRSVGAFLQQRFTTRPATERQLASGIAAAEELQDRFLHSVPHRPRLWRRLWCMGMPQTALGVSVGSTAAMLLFQGMFYYLR